MKCFLKSLIEALVVINLIAWTVPLLEEIKIHRSIGIDGIVISSQAIDDSVLTSQGTLIHIDQARVRVKYNFNQQVFENIVETAWLDGAQRTGNELKKYYYEGRKVVVWINPVKPDEARLDRKNTFLVLPELFLFILMTVSVFYIFGAKND